MKLAKILLALLPLPSLAQPTIIQAGSPSDQYFTGGVGGWPVPLPAPLAFLRYGTTFKYDIPVSNGFYNILFMFVEPNKTGTGQRVFTVTANGQTSDPIDLFALMGGINKPYGMNMQAFVGAGKLHLSFNSSVGNAVVSEIYITVVPYVMQCTCSTPP